ncbi:MAG: TolC family protein [Tannerella sp.]|jgi:outer membrane protein TolC|nr:TolC family protein [Tannerella sp.]
MKICLISLVLGWMFWGTVRGQQQTTLTIEQAVNIALQKSYTVQSNDEDRKAMQYEYLYYKAQFKPRLDLNLYTPSWDEQVSAIAQVDDLPVYNSTSSIRFGGDLKFTYVLPTGGNLALSGNLYHENLRATFAQDYSTLRRKQAFSQFGLIFDQPVFTKNKLRENLKVAQYQYERAELFFTRTQMDIVYNVTKSFYEVYKAAYERQINEEQLRNAQEALRIAKLKFETGNIPEGDLLVTEINALQSDVNLLESSGKYELQKDEFKLLVGIDMTEEIDIVAEMDFETVMIDLHIAIEQALANRLEVKETEYDVKLQEIEIDRAKREREIKGNIFAYYDFTGLSTQPGNISELFRSSFDNFMVRPPNRGVTFTLTVPILDWGRGRNIVRSRTIRLKEKQLKLENINDMIVKEIREIVRTVNEAEKRFRINQKNKDNATNSYRISRLRFENGDLSGQELATEQERLSQVQLAFIDAYITYQLALADLKRRTMWDFENNRSYKINGYMENR